MAQPLEPGEGFGKDRFASRHPDGDETAVKPDGNRGGDENPLAGPQPLAAPVRRERPRLGLELGIGDGRAIPFDQRDALGRAPARGEEGVENAAHRSRPNRL